MIKECFFRSLNSRISCLRHVEMRIYEDLSTCALYRLNLERVSFTEAIGSPVFVLSSFLRCTAEL